ncbi:MAG TPA: hypothetical protein VMW65_04165, partial [Chloroflexota bacterium]|nr:hypothetical protein [Chloroflexota bacterium]
MLVKQYLPQLTMEFAYTDGHVAERRLPLIAVPRGKQRKGQIYVLIGTEGPAGDSFVEYLRKQIADFFYRDPSRSLTSSLVRAIQRTNEELFADNERAIRTDRQYATVVCVVLRGEDAYFALVGRAAAFLVCSNACERFGRGDPRPGERPVELLGQLDEIDVELHHRPFVGDAAVVLTTSGLLDLLEPAPEVSLRCDPERLVATMRRLSEEGGGRRAFRSLVVAPEESGDDVSDDSDLDDEPPPVSRRGRRELPDQNGHDRRLPFSLPRSRRSPEPESPRPQIASERIDLPRRSGQAIPKTRSSPGVTPNWESPGREPMPRSLPLVGSSVIRRRSDRFDEDSASFPDVSVESRQRTRSAKSDRRPTPAILAFEPEPEERLPTARRRPRRSMPRLNVIGILTGLIKKVTISWRAVLVAALVVALFFLGYVIFLIPARILQGGASYTNAMARLSQAQQLEQQALGQSDALVRRHLLEEAEVLSQAALSAQPNDNAVVTVSARIEKEYRSATGITDLPAPTRVVQLPTVADEIVRNGNDVYVLDRTNSLVYKYLLNADGTQILPAQSPTLVRKGDHIGAVTVGQLSHIAWMPAGSARAVPALLALDTAGFLVEYDPTHGLTTQRLRSSDSW